MRSALMLLLLAPVLVLGGGRAHAYSCTVSPDGKSVIVKVSNPAAFKKSCTVNCQFDMPGGSASVSCSDTVPAGATDHELCVKPTGGDKYTFSEGNERCVKQ